jgi:hypothetical protein
VIIAPLFLVADCPSFCVCLHFFCRDEKQQLLLGIRRANRQPTNISSSVLSSDSMHIGILAAAAHAAANNSPFTIFYNPRLALSFGSISKICCTCAHI